MATKSKKPAPKKSSSAKTTHSKPATSKHTPAKAASPAKKPAAKPAVKSSAQSTIKTPAKPVAKPQKKTPPPKAPSTHKANVATKAKSSAKPASKTKAPLAKIVAKTVTKTKASTPKVGSPSSKPTAKVESKKPVTKAAVPKAKPAATASATPTQPALKAKTKRPMKEESEQEIARLTGDTIPMSGSKKKGDEILSEPILNAVKRLIIMAKRQGGFLTYDEFNEVLPQETLSADHIERVMNLLSEANITLVEGDIEFDFEGDAESEDSLDTDDELSRTDDPVRMYLREMGGVELLSREGEIEIAKRIEEGKVMMIQSLLESPHALQRFTSWYDDLTNEKILLREIVDLDSTLNPEDGFPGEGSENEDFDTDEVISPKKKSASAKEDDFDDDDTDSEDAKSEEDKKAGAESETSEEGQEGGGGVSIAAMEEALLPKVLELLDEISPICKQMINIQDNQLSIALGEEKANVKNKSQYDDLGKQLVAKLKDFHLSNACIESIKDELYATNREIIQIEGQLVRLAESSGVGRPYFLKHYHGHELDLKWWPKLNEGTPKERTTWGNFVKRLD